MTNTRRNVALLVALCLVIVAVLCVVVTPQCALAEETRSETVPYNSYNGLTGDELHNYAKRNTASSQAPAFTVLVHGQGGNASHWGEGNEEKLFYDELSLFEQISFDANADVYIASVKKVNPLCQTDSASHYHHTGNNGVKYYQCDTNCPREFTLKKIEKTLDSTTHTYVYSENDTHKIDFNKHNVILFEGSRDTDIHVANLKVCGGNNSTHDVAYSELELVIDTLLSDYRYVTAVTPKINLISHSRGGILSMMYATNHPYNVASLISMGTPYNGSLFGKSNWILEGLQLTNSVNCPSGQDIQSEDKQKELRDNWNKMLTDCPDANINAVTVGTKTQLSFIAGLIDSGAIDRYLGQYKWLNGLLSALTEYTGQAIAKLHNDYPVITEMVFQCANILVDIGQLFADEYTADEIEALQQIIYNCEIAYGDLVIKDDMFIDYDSQTAKGYNGINVVTHVYNRNNANYELTAVEDVAIPHNLETRDLQILGEVLLRLNYGACQNVYNADLEDNRINVTVNANNFAKVEFTATYDGYYNVVASTSLTKSVVDANGNLLVNSTASSAKFYGEKGNKYSIYIGSASGNAVMSTVNVTMDDLSGAVGQTIESGKSITFVKSYSSNTVKTVQINSSLNVNVYKDGNLVAASYNGSVDIMFTANASYYFEIANNTSSNVNLSVNITNVQGLSLDSEKTVAFYGAYKYNSFTSNASGDYTFSFTRQSSSALPSLEFYTSDFQRKSVSMTVNYGNLKVYKLSLSVGETVYFGYVNDADFAENAKVLVKKYTSEYSWKLDGKTIENSTLVMQRNGEYSGVLSFYYNDQLLEGEFCDLKETGHFEITNSRVKVKPNTPLSYDNDTDTEYKITWGYPDYDLYKKSDALKIIVIPRTGITLDTKNVGYYKFNIREIDRQDFGQLKEAVSIYFNFTNSNNDVSRLDYYITTNTYKLGAELYALYGHFHSGFSTLEAVKITYYYNKKSVTYTREEYPEVFEDSVAKINGYFDSGSGAVNDGYTISNADQLNYIRELSSGEMILPWFKLSCDITLQGTWTPIKPRFSGLFDGDGHTIYNLNISVTDADDYGLFGTVSGTVKNVKFKNVSITGNKPDLSFYTLVGVVAGRIAGSAINCSVEGNINVVGYMSWIGGIAGLASGTIKDCSNTGCEIYGSGYVGGIVGLSSGAVIENCTNSARITSIYDTESGCAAGIAGKNNTDGTIKGCTNKGTIVYEGKYSWSSAIRPCIAQIVGWNESGTLQGNTCGGKCEKGNLINNQKSYFSEGEVGRTGE